MKTVFRQLWKLALSSIILIAGILIFSDYWIKKESNGMTYDSISSVPNMPTGLVLGTSARVVGGGKNLYFHNRIEAAAQLFKENKVKYLIVSGDNSIREYNETRDMKRALLNLGIPEDKIVEDFAGFRTLDSVLRAKEVFGQDSILVISQEFHNQRAIFIAKNNDIYALGFNAKDVPRQYSIKTNLREYLAKVKAMADVYVLNTMPKFYLDKEVFPDE